MAPEAVAEELNDTLEEAREELADALEEPLSDAEEDASDDFAGFSLGDVDEVDFDAFSLEEDAPEADPRAFSAADDVDDVDFDAFSEDDDFDAEPVPDQGKHSLVVRESSALAKSEHDLWQDPEAFSEDTALVRRFTDKDVPDTGKRRITGKAVGKALLKTCIFLLVSALVATLAWATIYAVGTQTPASQMPAELWGFFQRLFG